MEDCSVNTGELDAVKRDLNNLEQYGRKNNLEIHGLSYAPNEDLVEKLGQVAAVLGVSKPDTSTIESVHRLPAKLGKVPAIIARFVNRSVCEHWLMNRKKLRAQKIDGHDVYINENMTAVNRAVFYKARILGRELQFKFVWNRHGTTYMRKDESDKVHRITCAADLDKVAPQ
ncbi:uncharacterized protein LOC135378411 [Ornithodoros turicata]|uniref:uncharacterized protein LOC135378411 n=1 Tax=Ornithodoros turicata TaxID=34597 RepID=UPI003139D859